MSFISCSDTDIYNSETWYMYLVSQQFDQAWSPELQYLFMRLNVEAYFRKVIEAIRSRKFEVFERFCLSKKIYAHRKVSSELLVLNWKGENMAEVTCDTQILFVAAK